jgi:hypothetical protein
MPVTPCICGGIRQLPCISMRRVSVRCGTMVAGRIVPGMMIVFPVHMLPTMHGDLQRAANEQGRSAAELVRRRSRLRWNSTSSGPRLRAGEAGAIGSLLSSASGIGFKMAA